MLKGTYVTLRVLERADIEQVRQWRNSPENYSFFANRDFISEARQEHWYASKVADSKDVRLMIVNNENSQSIGVTHLEDVNHRARNASWGIYIGDPAYRTKIYAAESVFLLLEYGFGYLNLHKIYGNTLATNKRGRAFHQFAGFKEEATFKDHVYADGRFQDLIWIAQMESGWRSHRKKLQAFIRHFDPSRKRR